MHAMASQRSLVNLLAVLFLLCGACAAAKRGYHVVSMEKLLRSKAHIDCPPLVNSVTSSGNKLTIPAVCGLPGPPDPPPKCCGAFERQVFHHDMNRLRTLLQRSSVSSSAAASAPSADPFSGTPFFGPVPSADPWFGPGPSPISSPPVAPPAEAPAVTIPDTTGSSFDTMAFVVTVGFGTPAKNYSLIFDTGSDVSWIQCQPCSGCYKQQDPVFDPAMSSTYSAVPCGHPHCAAAGGNCSSNGTCLYEVTYGDDSSTAGVLSHETLSLTSNRSFPGFAFGCGQTNLGNFGEVDGLIGLGRGALSLSSQAAATLGARFSYCLASYDTVHGYLTVGSATTPDPNDVVQYTAMKTKKDYPSLYFVELVAIDIGGYVVPVPPTVFTKDGTLLDSGTTLMYLPTEAYTLLRDRFKYVMNWTGYNPAPAYDPLDTCYDFSGQNTILLPAVSFNFSDGAVFGLSPVAILVYPDDTAPATGCFAFLPRPSTMPFNIIGNIQQKGTEIIYDVAAEQIGFGQDYC